MPTFERVINASYDFPWYFDSWDGEVFDGTAESIPNTHAMHLFGHATGAVPWVDPYGRDIFIYPWSNNKSLFRADLATTPPGDNQVYSECSYQATLPMPLPVETGSNSIWPDATADLDPPFESFTFGDADRGCHKFVLKEGIQPGPVCRFENPGQAAGYRTIDSSARKVIFRCYFDAPTSKVIPPGVLGFFYTHIGGFDTSYDFSMMINQPIYGGVWNLIELDLPALGAEPWIDAYYDDAFEAERTAIAHSDVYLIVINAYGYTPGVPVFESGLYDADGNITLYMAAGRQVISFDTEDVDDDTTGTNDETDATSCVSESEQYDLIATQNLYGPAVAIDISNNKAFVMSGVPFTCFMDLSSDCIRLGQTPGKIWCGDESGYINKAYEQTAFSRGHRGPCIVYDVVSATATTVTLDISSAGALPTTGDGIKGLAIRVLHADDTVENLIALSNTTNVITIDGTFGTTPVEGEQIHIGPIDCFAEFEERHYMDKVTAEKVIFDVMENAGGGTRDLRPYDYDFKVYGSLGRSITVNTAAPLITLPMNTDKAFRFRNGIPIFRRGLGAIRYRIEWTQQFGQQEIRRLAVLENIPSDEEGRA